MNLNRLRHQVVRTFAKSIPKDPNKPKKAASAYSLFVKDNYQYTEGHQNDRLKAVAAQWKAADTEAKNRYLQQAEVARVAYKKAIENYDPSVWENRIANDKKPPQSGYSYFLKDIFEDEKGNHIKENGKVGMKEVMRAVGRRWQELPELEKVAYQTKALGIFEEWKKRNSYIPQ